MTDQADTPDPIGEWLAAAEKATPGEWWIEPEQATDTSYTPAIVMASCAVDYWSGDCDELRVATGLGSGDAGFIAASRNVVPAVHALVAELAAARDREAAVRAAAHDVWDWADRNVQGGIPPAVRRLSAALSQSEPTKERSE